MVTTVTLNAGQVCSAATRVVAQSEILDPLLDAAADAMAAITVGRGIDDPMLGPLVSREQRERVLGYVEHGLEQGATARIGGAPYDRADLADGFFVPPTVLTDVRPEMRVAQEEIFGPVITTLEVADEDEAIAVANGTDYGLAAGVYTRDFDRAMRVSHALEAGQVFVNEYLAGGVETAFGGYKRSGWGREKGTAAIHDYTQLKTTIFRFG
jgi:aldehyde dehydrogenase (NAD+)